VEPLESSPEFRRVLERLRSEPERPLADDLGAAEFDRYLLRICRPVLNDAGLGLMVYTQCQWFLRELARLLRKRIGPDLAFELDLLVRKWSRHGLDAGLVQALVCRSYEQLTALPQGSIPGEEDATA
jgi:hypothetical protein